MADNLPSGDPGESIRAAVLVRIAGTTATVRWAVSKIRVWLRRYEHPSSVKEKPKSMQLRLDDVPSLTGGDTERASIEVHVIIAGPTEDVELVGRRFHTWLLALPNTGDRPHLGTAFTAEIADVTRETMRSA